VERRVAEAGNAEGSRSFCEVLFEGGSGSAGDAGREAVSGREKR